MKELLCVRCSTTLVPMQLEGETTFACPSGHGMWLSRSQLARLVDDQSDEAPPEAEAKAWKVSDDNPPEMVTERYRSCPVCGETLRKDDWKYGSGVVIDVCDEHGIWVDDTEIEQIEAWEEAWDAHTNAIG